jgi:uncharacterized phage protein gp47/JayE
MPWNTPALRDVRGLVRDMLNATLPGADANVPNSVLRVLSDSQGALCHLTLQYIDWLALQLLPDTAETEWLDRHGNIWLKNADGTTGRKQATLASGTVTMTGIAATTVPVGTQLFSSVGGGAASYETTELIFLAEGSQPTPVAARALDPGTLGNLDPGFQLGVTNAALPGVDGAATVVTMDGGTDTETDDELRRRVLLRIQQPPQGGDATDYVQWALAVPGCTRAWCAPLEMGIGTVTVRVMFDDLRAAQGGFPTFEDLATITAYLDTVRPVAVKDFFVVAPVPQRIDVQIAQLNSDTPATRAAIEDSLQAMLLELAAPGQTIYAAWKSAAILNAPGVVSFDLQNGADDVMLSPGHMATLGDIIYV